MNPIGLPLFTSKASMLSPMTLLVSIRFSAQLTVPSACSQSGFREPAVLKPAAFGMAFAPRVQYAVRLPALASALRFCWSFVHVSAVGALVGGPVGAGLRFCALAVGTIS